MRDPAAPPTFIGWCDACGKRFFDSRKAAKRSKHRNRGEPLRAYRCPVQPDLWHIGHLPLNVRAGLVTAAECYPRKEPSDATD